MVTENDFAWLVCQVTVRRTSLTPRNEEFRKLQLRSYSTLEQSLDFPADVSHCCDRPGLWWCQMWRNQHHGIVSDSPAGISATPSPYSNWLETEPFRQPLTVSQFNAINCLRTVSPPQALLFFAELLEASSSSWCPAHLRRKHWSRWLCFGHIPTLCEV